MSPMNPFPVVHEYLGQRFPDMDVSDVIQQGTVACLLKYVPPLPQDAGCLDVLSMFIKDQGLYSVAIVNEHFVPVGVIDRQSLVEIFIHPFARDLNHKKTIREFMDPNPIVIDVHTGIDDLAGIIIDAGMRHMVNGYIITQNGLYAGMGTGHDLLDEITRRKQAHLYYLAHFDQLTGLPNRLLFEDRLQRACLNAQRGGRVLALLFIDLDRFKFINDTFGHPSGDLLLRGVAEQLVSCIRKCDTVARLSGDEFTIILENIKGISDSILVAENLASALSRPFSILGNDLHITSSIGISLYPDHDASPEGLIRKADAAMYKAKESYRGRCLVYDETMDSGVLERLTIEAGLRLALERNEFALHYQPQCNAVTGEIVGVEVLIRWHHPQLGLVSPAKFIPIAEETGLIVPIGEWVLREACRQHIDWKNQGLPPIRVAVNISAVQFRQKDFHQLVQKIVEETGIKPECLELELTEGVVMGDAPSTIDSLAQLRHLGVRLAIDDFGTGYSSLSYLREFSLDRLKIDQSFIRNIDKVPANLAIVRAIVALGKNLGLDIIAEGIESNSELALVAANDCAEVQGYHISRPVPADHFVEWFLSRNDRQTNL
ncbi:putative bifunctional diguanylate cyclase/phosphodiesterase [Methylocaldum sp.]|uniref:putative bifunctional diguanylate cyclase/phosphodiesterase n=1 Tax=Methylocaldum sp. TaxID=1969727 RepID=UPI002D235220|nr:EAL domain-containing protein [Methylocaldum sp.]HYE38087.1 EAL domain-containing protein [Methylocaldum sp.]